MVQTISNPSLHRTQVPWIYYLYILDTHSPNQRLQLDLLRLLPHEGGLGPGMALMPGHGGSVVIQDQDRALALVVHDIE